MGKKATADVAFRFGGRLVGTGLQAATLVLMARTLGPDLFGTYSAALAAGYLASGLLSFGGPVRLLRLSAESHAIELVSDLFALRIIGSIAAFGIALLLLPGPLGVAAGALVLADGLMEFEQARMSGMGRHVRATFLVIVQRFVPLICVIGMLVWQPAAYALLSIGGAIVAIIALRELLGSVGFPSNLIGAARSSAGYWMSSAAANLNQLEMLVLKPLVAPSVLGVYAAAGRIANPLTIFVSALQVVLVPELARASGTDGESRVFRRFFWVTLAYVLALIIFSPVIVSLALLVLGSSFESARGFLYAMVLASGLSCLSQVFQSRLIAHGRPAPASVVVIAGTIVGLAALAGFAILDGGSWLWAAPVVAQTAICAGMILISRALIGGGRAYRSSPVE